MKKISAGTWIENPLMGQRALILRLPEATAGQCFEMEYICRPFTGKGSLPLHYHPTYTERFDILSGRARYRLGKDEYSAGPGEQIVFPPLIEHLHPWSDSNEELRFRLVSEASPPDIDGLNANINAGITIFGLARDGKADKHGLPNLLQQSVCAIKTIPGACPAGMSVGTARVVIGFLALLGHVLGYQASYPEYGEV